VVSEDDFSFSFPAKFSLELSEEIDSYNPQSVVQKDEKSAKNNFLQKKN
jgi:hypothetical protein